MNFKPVGHVSTREGLAASSFPVLGQTRLLAELQMFSVLGEATRSALS